MAMLRIGRSGLSLRMVRTAPLSAASRSMTRRAPESSPTKTRRWSRDNARATGRSSPPSSGPPVSVETSAVLRPNGAMTRTAEFPESQTKRVPSAARASICGSLKRASSPRPSAKPWWRPAMCQQSPLSSENLSTE
eukprot:Amastigsp_a842021_47.p6 type:complete len:136 gc:universal Amastigsp_a842021_47:1195-1602(+)